MSRSEKTIRIGAVRYLNTKPLVYRLTELAPQIDLSFDLPSRLADRLARGELDVALIPAVEALQNPEYEILSDACIACRGPVWSVKLFSRVPIAEIRTLALDEGSRTSAALVQILLAERAGLRPKLLPLAIGDSTADTQADAVLLIGDRAIHPPAERFAEVWDLGDEWCRWSELPFVFAMWTARRGIWEGEAPAEPRGSYQLAKDVRPCGTQARREPRPPKDVIAAALTQSRDAGLANLEQIARDEAGAVGLTTRECLHYFSNNLHFTLGTREREGLKLFHQHAARIGIAPKTFHLHSFNPDPTGRAELPTTSRVLHALPGGRG
jgi:chorismate dehydratase